MLKPFQFQPIVGSLRHQNGVHDGNSLDDENEEPETHLRENLQHEMRMREGSTKLLAAVAATAADPEVMLEGAKSLLVSKERMKLFRKELQRRKSGESLMALWALPPESSPISNDETSETLSLSFSSDPTSSVHDQRPCRAVISVSEIRIPLMWPEKEHFKNRGFLRRFAVFCLVRVGAQIKETLLLPCVDRADTDASFQDELVFKRVAPDFECVIEIYAHNLDEEIVSTPSLIRRKFSHVTASVGRTIGKRMAAGVGGGGEEVMGGGGRVGGCDGPEFALVARVTLRLDDVDEYGKAFDLEVLPDDSARGQLPLFGQISCRLAARPSLKVKTVMDGELFIKDTSNLEDRGGGMIPNVRRDWTPFWCRLCDQQISCWSSREEADSGRPSYMQMPVSAYRTQLSLHGAFSSPPPCSNSAKQSPSSLITLRDGIDTSEFLLAAPSDLSHQKWWSGLHQHLLDQSTWGRRVCESSMDLHGLDKSFINSPDFHDCFDSPAQPGSPFGTLNRNKSSAGKATKKDADYLRKSPKLTRANNLYDSVAISSPRASSFSSSMASPSPRTSSFSSSNSSQCEGGVESSRLRRTPSTSSSGSSSKSTPTTPKASASTALSAFPSLDEEELDKLLLKYTSSGSNASRGGASGVNSNGGFSSMTLSPSKRFNTLFPSMTLKPNRSTKKLPL